MNAHHSVLPILLILSLRFSILSRLLAAHALLVIGVVAAFVPARRAGTVDPALVLREQ